MQPADANALGYANTALITALFDLLADKGIIAGTDIESVVTCAIESLEPDRHIASINGAITFIKSAVIPQIRKTGAA
jgi:hypothetical protein